ncbi:MAG: long-chain fatty acid--CoA ligase [Elusimicrobia bacterium]|nr:long-chain fatty acid--CoA ligase [Elusimicrobiota bacterium]
MILLSNMLARSCQRHPEEKALIFQGKRWTYEALGGEVHRATQALAALGVRAGHTFALISRNSPEFVICYFALIELGAIAVPVNFQLKPEEMAYIFQDAGVVGAFTQRPFLAGVMSAARQVPTILSVVVTHPPHPSSLSPQPGGEGRGEGGTRELTPQIYDWEETLRRATPDALAAFPHMPRQENETTTILYTSGTTGKPKGVMLSHRNLLSNVEACCQAIELTAQDVFLCLLPMFHSFAWTTCVLVPLSLGAKIAIVESVRPFREVLRAIWKYRVTRFIAVPPIFAALLKLPFWRPLRFLNPVRVGVSGAAPLPPAVRTAFERKFGIPLLEGYGLTEASPVVSLNPWHGSRKDGSVGRPLPGVSIKIVGEDEHELPVGQVGEICVAGPNVMQGYYRRPQDTQEAFLPREGHNTTRWLRTGDLGRLDADGFLYIVDRKKDLIIVKGLNVYPVEVEEVLLTHPAVAEAAVIGVQDQTGDEHIIAYVTLKEGAHVEKTELLRLCRERLALFKCPKDLDIRTELPKNTLGKILKKELRNQSST